MRCIIIRLFKGRVFKLYIYRTINGNKRIFQQEILSSTEIEELGLHEEYTEIPDLKISYDNRKRDIEESAVHVLQSQIQALSDRNEFLEDCIAEMAMEVYSDPEEETV